MAIFDDVKEVIVEKLGTDADKVVPEARFIEDLGADSLDTVELVKSRNPQAIYCCDPVMGDVGRGVFVNPDLPDQIAARALPAADIAGLIEALRGGEALSFGTAGVGAVSDLCGMLLSDALGAEMVVVPYKGTGPAMTDLMGGQIDLMCDQTTNTANQIESGEVKPYAVTTRTRIDRFPDLPTVVESGVDGFEITAWHALWAPAGTPDDIRHRLAEALRTALHDATVKERFAALGTVPVADEAATPEALDTHFRSEVERWTRLIGSLETPAQ